MFNSIYKFLLSISLVGFLITIFPSNKDLGKLITKGTVYIECHMTIAKIKKMIAQAENRKAFFKEHK